MTQISKGRNITAWVLCALLGFVYVSVGLPKLGLFSAEMVTEVTENFRRYGHTDWFRMFIGLAEVLGGLGLLIPRLTSLAALGLIVIMAGAIFTHVTNGEAPQAIGPLVLLALLALTAWLRRPQLFVGRALASLESDQVPSEKKVDRSAA